MHRRLKALGVLALGETGARYRSGIGKARLTAATAGQTLRERSIAHHGNDYRRERLVALLGKRGVPPTSGPERTHPMPISSARRVFTSVRDNELRRAGGSQLVRLAKSGNALDSLSMRRTNRVVGYGAAGAASAGAQAKLADVIAAGGIQGAGRKRKSASGRVDGATLKRGKLDSPVRAEAGGLRSRNAQALNAVGSRSTSYRRSSEYRTVGDLKSPSAASMLRNNSTRGSMLEGSVSGYWNGDPNAPRGFSSPGKDYNERRQTRSVGRGAYGDAGPAASARYGRSRAGRAQPALTINFSPSVVLQGIPDHERKRHIVDALSQYSHELVQLIEREIAKQRRVEF